MATYNSSYTGEQIDAVIAAAIAQGGVLNASEKESFTPSIPAFAGTLTGQKWRIGNLLYMEIKGVASGAASGPVVLTLPDSLQIDSTVSGASLQDVIWGKGGLFDGGSYFDVNARYDTATTIKFWTMYAGGTAVTVNNFDATTPSVLTSGDILTMRLIVPISGWDVMTAIS